MYEVTAVLVGGELEASASLEEGDELVATAELMVDITINQIADPYTTETGNGTLITE